MNAVKDLHGVPFGPFSCHTSLVEGYVLERHVRAPALERLLAERPRARLLAERPRALGIAVAGMPVGSVGMEVEGVAYDLYEIILLGPDGERPFGRDAVES